MRGPHLASSSSVALASCTETCRLQAGMFRLLVFVRPQYLADDINLVLEGPRRRLRSSTDRSCAVPRTHNTWHRRESRTVCCRDVQLMPTLFLKLRKIWQRLNGQFVDFNDPTQVWRRPSNKRLRVSTNDLYFQKLELLTYISAADSMGLHSLVFT